MQRQHRLIRMQHRVERNSGILQGYAPNEHRLRLAKKPLEFVIPVLKSRCRVRLELYYEAVFSIAVPVLVTTKKRRDRIESNIFRSRNVRHRCDALKQHESEIFGKIPGSVASAKSPGHPRILPVPKRYSPNLRGLPQSVELFTNQPKWRKA